MKLSEKKYVIAAGLALALAVSVEASRASAQPYHFEDSLRGSTSGNATGGSFGTDGWTITGVEDRIWYALPRLQSGSVEFTVSGITLANLPLADHELFAMYEAGYDIGEPIRYSPEFRQNHYKILMRIYGTPEPDRAGAIKLMWGLCPSGAPGWHDAAGCGCESFFEEPFDDPGPWTGAPVRIRIEWGGGITRLLRDGVEVVGIDWSESGLVFGPQELHMMIGSPRNDGGLSAMPIGAVFSDLVIDAEMGPLATCPGTPMLDAGVPLDAGACDGSGVAIADALAASWTPGVAPDVGDLEVSGDGAEPTGIAYLRFPAVAGSVTRATLTMHVSNVPSAEGGSGQVCRVDGGVWDEATLTWATRPTVSAVCSGGARDVVGGAEVTWDVTSLVTPGVEQNLAIVSIASNGVHYHSRESGGCELGPRLDVELAPAPDAGTSATDGGGTPGLDAGSMRADSGAGRGSVGGGCACRTAPASRSPRGALALALLGLGLALARTRRRARHRHPRARSFLHFLRS